jgi:hypothetical protein
MRGAGFRDSPLGDIDVDVRRMLASGETLFVEHKGPGADFVLAKAMASFANQLGGWVLVNTEPAAEKGNGSVPCGPLQEWVTKPASPIDAVRDRIGPHLEPLPPFETATFAVSGEADDILVIRVYESADTPQIASNGAIYVRGVAQDERYLPRPVANQQVLSDLVACGERSRERAAELLAPRSGGLPLANGGIGLWFNEIPHRAQQAATDGPAICVRAVPQTTGGRFAAWARSARAVEAARGALGGLTGSERRAEVSPHS